MNGRKRGGEGGKGFADIVQEEEKIALGDSQEVILAEVACLLTYSCRESMLLSSLEPVLGSTIA